MSEKWSVEQLFTNENNGNPFSRGPEEMWLWECHNGKEAFRVWRGYDIGTLQSVVKRMKQTAGREVTYCVEFPNRKGHRDGFVAEKRKFDGGAKCLPKAKNKFLVTLIENKWGATLNETVYMATNGRKLAFYMKPDKMKETVFEFDTWEQVQEMAYAQ